MVIDNWHFVDTAKYYYWLDLKKIEDCTQYIATNAFIIKTKDLPPYVKLFQFSGTKE